MQITGHRPETKSYKQAKNDKEEIMKFTRFYENHESYNVSGDPWNFQRFKEIMNFTKFQENHESYKVSSK